MKTRTCENKPYSHRLRQHKYTSGNLQINTVSFYKKLNLRAHNFYKKSSNENASIKFISDTVKINEVKNIYNDVILYGD